MILGASYFSNFQSFLSKYEINEKKIHEIVDKLEVKFLKILYFIKIY